MTEEELEAQINRVYEELRKRLGKPVLKKIEKNKLRYKKGEN